MAISPDGRWLVTGSQDKTARLWDMKSDDPTATARVLSGHKAWVNALTISPDGRWLVTGSYDNTARLWDLEADDPAGTARALSGHEQPVVALAISPDGRWLVTGSFDKTARLWPLTVEQLLDDAQRAVGRNFTRGEWEELFPGEDYRKTFEGLPAPGEAPPRSR
jgi:WD40 repeat protein